jgi:ribonuclease J
MLNHVMRRGADAVTAAEAEIHVSGHAAQDELRTVLQLLRPRYFVPIHGEYRQLAAHARLAADCGLGPRAVQLADSGDLLAVNDAGIAIGERVPVGQVFIDATLGEVDRTVLQDRRRIAGDGILVPVVALDRRTGAINGTPEIVARGFAPIAYGTDDALLAEVRRVVTDSLAGTSMEERTDDGLLRARIQTDLKRFLRRRTQRHPLVIPVIVEL